MNNKHKYILNVKYETDERTKLCSITKTFFFTHNRNEDFFLNSNSNKDAARIFCTHLCRILRTLVLRTGMRHMALTPLFHTNVYLSCSLSLSLSLTLTYIHSWAIELNSHQSYDYCWKSVVCHEVSKNNSTKIKLKKKKYSRQAAHIEPLDIHSARFRMPFKVTVSCRGSD